MDQTPSLEPHDVSDRVSEDAEYAVRAFRETVEFDDYFAGGPYAPEGYLESYLYYWLSEYQNGIGIGHTRGSYEVFMETAMRLAEIVMYEPTALDCSPDKPRRIVGIFEPNLDRPHCFSPSRYELLKFDFLTRDDPYFTSST